MTSLQFVTKTILLRLEVGDRVEYRGFYCGHQSLVCGTVKKVVEYALRSAMPFEYLVELDNGNSAWAKPEQLRVMA
jgi:hypothetical protein